MIKLALRMLDEDFNSCKEKEKAIEGKISIRKDYSMNMEMTNPLTELRFPSQE